MFKAEICPDTVRTSEVGIPFELTEKVDGQNLSFVNREDDLHIAQRSWVFSLTEIKEGEKVKVVYMVICTNGWLMRSWRLATEQYV